MTTTYSYWRDIVRKTATSPGKRVELARTIGLYSMDKPEPIQKDYYFTWGFGQGYDNHYTVIKGTRITAREKMVQMYGTKWGFMYESAEEAGVEQFNLIRKK